MRGKSGLNVGRPVTTYLGWKSSSSYAVGVTIGRCPRTRPGEGSAHLQPAVARRELHQRARHAAGRPHLGVVLEGDEIGPLALLAEHPGSTWAAMAAARATRAASSSIACSSSTGPFTGPSSPEVSRRRGRVDGGDAWCGVLEHHRARRSGSIGMRPSCGLNWSGVRPASTIGTTTPSVRSCAPALTVRTAATSSPTPGRNCDGHQTGVWLCQSAREVASSARCADSTPPRGPWRPRVDQGPQLRAGLHQRRPDVQACQAVRSTSSTRTLSTHRAGLRLRPSSAMPLPVPTVESVPLLGVSAVRRGQIASMWDGVGLRSSPRSRRGPYLKHAEPGASRTTRFESPDPELTEESRSGSRWFTVTTPRASPAARTSVVDAQAAALREAGHTVVVVSERTDHRLSDAPTPSRPQPRSPPASVRRPIPELRRFRPDVVHVHNLFPQLRQALASRVERADGRDHAQLPALMSCRHPLPRRPDLPRLPGGWINASSRTARLLSRQPARPSRSLPGPASHVTRSCCARRSSPL